MSPADTTPLLDARRLQDRSGRVDLGVRIIDGKRPERTTDLIAPQLVTRDNVGSYPGW